MSSITCAIDQRGHGTLLRKHALHPTGLLGVVKAEEVGFTQTQRITWGQKEENSIKLTFQSTSVWSGCEQNCESSENSEVINPNRNPQQQ